MPMNRNPEESKHRMMVALTACMQITLAIINGADEAQIDKIVKDAAGGDPVTEATIGLLLLDVLKRGTGAA